jgi:ABC-2 family transporter protein
LNVLVLKEWRQLAPVRWGGIGLGALFALAFAAVAKLSGRGLLPDGLFASVSDRSAMYELLPATIALALWPLISLVTAVQAFAGDRSDGTEGFLLDRPVSRDAVWRARLIASIASLVVVMIVTSAIGLTFAALSGPPPAIGWSRWLILLGIGSLLGLIGWTGAVFAASLVPVPFAALLMGAGVGALPLLLVRPLSATFPYVRIHGVALGALVPWLLLPVFLLASHSSACRGEPATRGRVKRPLWVVCGGVVSIAVLFLIMAPIATRANARANVHSIEPSIAGGAAFVGSLNDGGWIVDVETGRKKVFLSPPVGAIRWRPDGRAYLLITSAEELGRPIMELRDHAGRRIGDRFQPRPGTFLWNAVWSHGKLVSRLVSGAGSEVSIYEPAIGEWKPTGYRREDALLELIGPTTDGRVFVLEEPISRRAAGGYEFVGDGKVLPVDPDSASIGAPSGTIPKEFRWLYHRHDPLSPSGLYALVRLRGHDDRWVSVLELGSGSRVPGLDRVPSAARWLADDRLVWIEAGTDGSRLMVTSIGGTPRAIREWAAARVGLSPSPDRRSLFVSVLPSEGRAPVPTPRDEEVISPPERQVGHGKIPEEIVYVADADRFIDLGPPFSDRMNDLRHTEWAGPKTLARIAPGVVYFEDIDAPGKRRFVLGGPGDLR